MAANKYYPEEVLVEKMQSGEYGWLEYINHHSAEWQEEYESYCLKHGLCISEMIPIRIQIINNKQKRAAQ